jgi:hypothetical protein
MKLAGHEFQRPVSRVLVAAALLHPWRFGCVPGTDITAPQVFADLLT